MNPEIEKQIVIEQKIKFDNHRKQIPIIKDIFDKVWRLYCHTNYAEFDSLVAIVKIAIQRIIHSNFELNRSIVLSLKDSNFTSVDVLARASIEYSVNVIYILSKDCDKRAMSYLNSYLTSHQNKLKRWVDYQKSSKIDSKNSEFELDNFTSYKKQVDAKFDFNKSTKWPNAWERFKACSLENDYITLYKSASDSIHSVPEDSFNYFICSQMIGKKNQKLFTDYRNSERASFSIYLGLHSLRFLIESMQFINDKEEKTNTYNASKELIEDIKKMTDKHDNELVELQNKFSN